MADENLRNETADALLNAIKAYAEREKMSGLGLEQAAHAYALVVGSEFGKAPKADIL